MATSSTKKATTAKKPPVAKPAPETTVKPPETPQPPIDPAAQAAPPADTTTAQGEQNTAPPDPATPTAQEPPTDPPAPPATPSPTTDEEQAATQETPPDPEATQPPPTSEGPEEKPKTPPDPATQAAPAPAAVGGFKLTRELKVTKPLMKGEDVQAVQAALIAQKLFCGVEGVNGMYGASTALAVRHFQSMNRLIVSGKVEKFTVTALGGTWEEPPKE